MGQDWLPKREKAIKRRLDRELADLTTPSLFTQAPTSADALAAAELSAGVRASVGDTFVASLSDNGQVALYRGNDLVGRLSAPSTDQTKALSASPAVATVCDVLPYTDGRSVEVRLS